MSQPQRSKWVVDLESVVNSIVKGFETFTAKGGPTGVPGTEPPPDEIPDPNGPSPCPEGMEMDATGVCNPEKRGISPVIWIGLAVAGVAAAYFIVKRTTKK